MLDSSTFTDRENFFERMQSFKKVHNDKEWSEGETMEDDKVFMFGENFVLHTNEDQSSNHGPLVSSYQSLECNINTSLAKFCTGSMRDAFISTNLSQALPRPDQVAYTGQMLVDATYQFALLFEFFGFIRSEIKFDLNLIRMRPLLFQVRKAYTFGMT